MTKTVALALAMGAVLVLACTPAPAAVDRDKLIEAFVGHTQAADRTLRLEFGGEWTLGMRDGVVRSVGTGSLAAAGADYQISARSRITGGRQVGEEQGLDLVVVDGNGYSRDLDSGRWEIQPLEHPVSPRHLLLDPFGRLAVDDLEYVERDDADAGTGHLLRLRNLDPAIARITAIPEERRRRMDWTGSQIDYYVNDAGVPLAVQVRIVSNTPLSSKVDYVVSSWGEPIVIVPPIP